MAANRMGLMSQASDIGMIRIRERPVPAPSSNGDDGAPTNKPGGTPPPVQPQQTTGLKPMKALKGGGFPTASSRRDKVYTTRPLPMPNATSTAVAPPATSAAKEASSFKPAPMPKRGVDLTQPLHRDPTTSMPKPSAASPSPSSAQQAQGRQLLGGTNDGIRQSDMEGVERGCVDVDAPTGGGESGSSSGKRELDIDERLHLCIKVLRSVVPAQRLVAVQTLHKLLTSSEDTDACNKTHAALTQSIESGQRLFLVTRCVGDPNLALHDAAMTLLEALLSLQNDDEASRAAAVRLSLFGAPAVEDEDAASVSVAAGDTPFETIGQIAFDDPWGAVAELQLHVRLCNLMRYEDLAGAARQWRMLEAITESRLGAHAVISNPQCAAAVRKALDVLLVEGILLLEGGVEVAASVAGVLRRCASWAKKAATMVFANYADVLALLATSILNDDETAPGSNEPLLHNDVGRRCCLNIFSLFANCARHGYWRDDLTDLLLQGTHVGSLRVLEALVLTHGSGIHKSLKAFISDHVMHQVKGAINESSTSVITGLHLLATWFSTCTIDALAHGEKTPVELITTLEGLSKTLCTPALAATLIDLTARGGAAKPAPNGSELTDGFADAASATHGRVRLAVAIAKLLPKTAKSLLAVVGTVCEGLGTSVDAAAFAGATRRRRAYGPVVASVLELIRIAATMGPIAAASRGGGASAAEELAPFRTSVLLKASLTALELVRATQHGLDAVHDLLMPVVVPPEAIPPPMVAASSKASKTTTTKRSKSDESDEEEVEEEEASVHGMLIAALAKGFLSDEETPATEGASAADVAAASNVGGGLLSLSHWAWQFSPAFFRPTDTATPEDVQQAAEVRRAWVSWLRWLIGHVKFTGLHHRDGKTMCAARALLAVAHCWLQHGRAAEGDEPFKRALVSVAGSAARSYFDSMAHGGDVGTSGIRALDLSPTHDEVAHLIDTSVAGASPLVLFVCFALAGSAVHPEVRGKLLARWVCNMALGRTATDMASAISSDPVYSELRQAASECTLVAFFKGWRGHDVVALIDSVSEAFHAADATELSPVAVLVAEAVASARRSASDFELGVLDDVVETSFGGGMVLDVDAWTAVATAASAGPTLEDVFAGNAGAMVD